MRGEGRKGEGAAERVEDGREDGGEWWEAGRGVEGWVEKYHNKSQFSVARAQYVSCNWQHGWRLLEITVENTCRE